MYWGVIYLHNDSSHLSSQTHWKGIDDLKKVMTLKSQRWYMILPYFVWAQLQFFLLLKIAHIAITTISLLKIDPLYSFFWIFQLPIVISLQQIIIDKAKYWNRVLIIPWGTELESSYPWPINSMFIYIYIYVFFLLEWQRYMRHYTI